MDQVAHIRLPLSIANKAVKRMMARHPGNSEKECRVGMLGEFAVVEFLSRSGHPVYHNSIAEMRFAETEGATDLYFFDDVGCRINAQVKASNNDCCWIKRPALMRCLSTGVDLIYFVDVFFSPDGVHADCFVFHNCAPQEIRDEWYTVEKGARFIHPVLHRAKRKYSTEATQ